MPNTHNHGGILALDASPHLIRTALLEPVDGAYRLVGWADGRREAEQPLLPQLAAVVQRLGNRLGRPLWQPLPANAERAADKISQDPPSQDGPLLESDDPVGRPALAQVTVTASLRSPLRVVAVTLTPASAEAVRRAARSSPAEVVAAISLSAQTRIGDLAAALVETQAEAVVVAGGYDLRSDHAATGAADGAASAAASAATAEPLARPLLLCDTLRRALERLSPGQRPLLIYAGSSLHAARGTALLQRAGDGVRVEQVANVQPAAGQLRAVPLAQALTRADWRAQRRHPAFEPLREWGTSPGQGSEGTIIGHGQGFAGVVQAWRARERLAELHALYAAPDRWLHVLATGERTGRGVDEAAGVRLVYATPGERQRATAGWPPLRLVSGPWPEELWPMPRRVWWDRSGMVPMLAAVGQSAPHAAMSVLSQDLLRLRER